MRPSRRLVRASIAGWIGALAAISPPVLMAHAATPSLVRLAGPDRVGTAIAIAKQHATFSDYAILARADAYPDALAGAALAGAYQAPLYLTPSDHLDPRVLTQLAAQDGSAGNMNVILLGTEDVMSAEVAAQLQAAGITHLIRYGGSDRYETAAIVAKVIDSWIPPEYSGACRFVVATGHDYPDAVSGAWLAYSLGAPLIYTDGAAISATEVAAIQDCYPQLPREYIVVGGPAEAAIPKLPPASKITVYAGKDRYDTSARVLEAAGTQPLFGPTETTLKVSIATGLNWPDALTGGTLGPVVLADPNVGLAPEVAEALKSRASEISTVQALGGTDVLPDSIAQAAQQAAATP